ncbi:MAG: fibronectin type III domain-containing protein [Bacteroidales bacterium]|nr:fibronectin type III domain-containing protein [Bacteroidales bacterium]
MTGKTTKKTFRTACRLWLLLAAVFGIGASAMAVTPPPAKLPVASAQQGDYLGATIDSSQIQYWVGEGSNYAIMAINWEGVALAWGYRFDDSTTTLMSMIGAIADADNRLSYSGSESYIANITYTESGYTLTGGANTYWMYAINGNMDVMGQSALHNGDFVKFGNQAAGTVVDTTEFVYNDSTYLAYNYVWNDQIIPVLPPNSSPILQPEDSSSCDLESGNLCRFTVMMTDSYGDGWNGASISVVAADGTEVANLTVSSGSAQTQYFSYCQDRSLSFVWHKGSYDNECSFIIYNPFEEEVLSQSNMSNFQEGAILSEINVDCSSCRAPSGLHVVQRDTTSLSIGWESYQDSALYAAMIIGNGDTLYNYNVQSPVTFVGLRPFTTYTIAVTRICESAQLKYSTFEATTGLRYTERIYVKTDGQPNGNGSSWATALDDPARALVMAQDIKNNYGFAPEIWVAEGTYYGDTTQTSAFQLVDGVSIHGGFEVGNTQLSQANPKQHPTVLDGQNRRRVMMVNTTFYETTTITGLTLTNGYCDSTNNLQEGAALSSQYGNNVITFEDCSFTNNTAYYGGAVLVTGTNFERCTFEGNTAARSGGAVYAWGGTFKDCLIANNTAQYGGGVYNDGRAEYNYTGGTFINCDIVANLALQEAGGSYGSGQGGTYINCVLHGNKVGLTSNQVAGNSTFSYCAIEGLAPAAGCIPLSADNDGDNMFCPRFVQPSAGAGADYATGNYQLMEGSVLVGTGSTDEQLLSELDLSGNTRVQQGRVEMGCYESPYEATNIVIPQYVGGIIYVDAQATGDGSGTSWQNAINSLSLALNIAPMAEGVNQIWVARGTYTADDTTAETAFYAIDGVSLYGGFAPGDTSIATRNLAQNQTILSGNNRQAILSQFYPFAKPTVVNGFSFMYGHNEKTGGATGGAVNMNTGLTIEQCTFSYNTANYGSAIRANGGTVSRCVLTNNYATYSGTIYAEGGFRIENSLVANNTAQYSAGLYVYNGENNDNSIIAYSTDFVQNITTESSYGAVRNTSLYNCVVWGNRQSDSSQVVSTIYNCNVVGSAIEDDGSGNNYGIQLSSSNTGDAMASPRFVNPSNGVGAGYEAGNFALAEGSILIGRGNNSAVVGQYDLAGSTRVQQGLVDIGCYESPYTAVSPFQNNPVYVSAQATGEGNGTSWDNAFTDPSQVLEMARIYGIDSTLDVWVAEGTYYGDTNADNAFNLVEGVNLIGGFAVGATQASQANPDQHPTVLSGQNQRGVLYKDNSNNSSPILVRGFNITGGNKCGNGMGAYIAGNVTLDKCYIYNNATSPRCSNGWGVAVYADGAKVSNCVIEGNGSLSSNIRSDVYISNGGRLLHSKIINNRGEYALITSYSLAEGNLIEHNTSTYDNVQLQSGSSFVGNTVANNIGGGITANGNVEIYNSVVWGNRTQSGEVTGIGGNSYTSAGIATDGYYYDSTSASYIRLSTLNEGSDNDNYPMFADPDGQGDYTLMSGSALIDAGDTSIAYLLDTDLEGKPRQKFERVDIGCYELDQFDACPRLRGLQVVSVTDNSAYVTFSYTGQEEPAAYQLFIVHDGDTVSQLNITATHTFVQDLEPQTEYTVLVRSVCENAVGKFATTTFTTRQRNIGDCQAVVTIGTGTGTTSYLPTQIYYCSSYTQQIFTADEMGNAPMRIDTVSFQYFFNSTQQRNVTLFLAHVSDSTFETEEFKPSTDFQQVYSNSQYIFSSQYDGNWCPIVLQEPFEYNGVDNLLVVMLDNNTDYLSSSDKFYTTPTDRPMAAYIYADGQTYDPANPPSYANILNYRSNVRFGGECLAVDTGDCHRPNVVVTSVTANSATLDFLASEGYEAQLRNVTAGEPFATATIAQTPITISGLPQITTYELRMRNRCDGDSSAWTTVRFSTLPSDSPVVYVKPQATGIADGSSWENATSDIAYAQTVATARLNTYGQAAQVWVAAGTYYGDTISPATTTSAFVIKPSVNVYGGFAGTETSLSQRDPKANPTILNGRSQRTVLSQSVNFTAQTAATWDGFTIANGYAYNNSTASGVNLRHYATLSNCVVTDNSSQNNNAYVVRVLGSSYNDYYDDSLQTYRYDCTARLDRVSIINNSGQYALYLEYATITNSLIANNNLTSSVINVYGSGEVNGVTVARNIYNSYVISRNFGTVINSVVWGNASISRQQFSNNENVFYSAVEGGLRGKGNIGLSSDNSGQLLSPAFVNPTTTAGYDSLGTADYRLASTSVCIGRGYNPAAYGTADLDGNNRLQNDALDLGAYESAYEIVPLPQYTDSVVYVAEGGRGSMDGTSWQNAMPDPDQALTMAASLGVPQVWVAAGTYYGDTTGLNAFTAKDGVDLLGGFSGQGTERNPALYATILDGRNQRRVLNQPATFEELTTWDGVTLTNGFPIYNSDFGAQVGAAAYLSGNFTLSNSTVCYNGQQASGSYIRGGAIVINGSETVNIVNCDIHHNGNTNTYSGGAIYTSNTTNVVNSHLHHNTGSNGGAIYVNSNTRIYNTLIDHNTSTSNGAAIYAASYVYLYNSTVVQNEVRINSNSYNGGIHANSANYINMYNTVVWGNRGTNGGVDNITNYYDSRLHASAIEGVVSDSIITLATENLAADPDKAYPAFVDPDNGDYRLHPSSALINRGYNPCLSQDNISLDFDLGGLDRLFDSTVDIGAYEYHGEQYCLTPSGLTASSLTENSAYLGWSSLGNYSPQTVVVTIADQQGNTQQSLTVNGANAGTFVTGLEPNTTYTATIVGLCADGNQGQQSPEVTFRTARGCDRYTEYGGAGNYTNGQYVPFGANYYYSFSQQLYEPSEVGSTPRLLTGLSFRLNSNTGSNTSSPHLKIYLGSTSRSNFYPGDSTLTSDEMTLVFDGEATFHQNDSGNWCYVPFDSNFYYNGQSNLVVATLANTYDSPTLYFATNSKYYSVAYGYNSSEPYSFGNRMRTSTTSYRADIRLHELCVPNACGTVNIVLAEADTLGATFAIGSPSVDGLEMDIRNLDATDSVWVNIGLTSTQPRIEGLAYNTNYEVRLRRICGDTAYSDYRYLDFRTLPSASPIVYVAPVAQGRADGTSWDNAMADLNRATATAEDRATTYGEPAQVWVAAGTYFGYTSGENAFVMRPGVKVYGGFLGNETDLAQRQRGLYPSILDGNNQRRVLYQSNSYTSATAALWDGFTIQNGRSSGGGGVYMREGSTLSNCSVLNNYSSSYGGGVYAYGNTYSSHYEQDSLGNNVLFYDFATRIVNCRIEGNSNNYYNGGGIYARYAEVTNCLVANNTSLSNGGGIYSDYAMITSTTVVANTASNYSGIGGGSTVASTNNVVWGNVNTGSNNNSYQTTINNLTYSAVSGPSGTLGSTNILLASTNSGSPYSPRFVMPSGGAGNQYAGGNWQPAEGSVLVGYGNNASLTQPTDLDGNARVQQGTVDMGCYESPYQPVTLPTYGNVVYVMAEGRGLMDGTSWQNAMPSLQDAIDIASQQGNLQVWVAEGTYFGDDMNQNAFTARSGVNVYGGFAGTEDSLSERQLGLHPSVLDGQRVQRVLYASVNTNTRWDGFTIQNGSAESGAGVYSGNGYFTLANSEVRNNAATSSGYGGGIRCYNNYNYIYNCLFEGNSATYGGACSGNANIYNSRFTSNSATRGGALYTSTVSLYNCIIDHNSASTYGGGIYSNSNSITIEGCDIVQNSCGQYGGGIYFYYGTAIINNSIVWGNKVDYYVNNLYRYSGSVTFNYSAIEQMDELSNYTFGEGCVSLASANDGTNLSFNYVRFMDPTHSDYHLHPTSNLVDAGSNDLATSTTDFDGAERIFGNSVDMGAYESSEQNDCPAVTGLEASNITATSALLTWSATGSNRYMVQIAQEGDSQWDTISTTDTALTVTNLGFNRTYTVRVRTLCSDGTSSFYSIPISFATECDPTTLDTLSNFTSLTPANNTVVYDRKVNFAWSSLPEATSYDLYVWPSTTTQPSTPSVKGLVLPQLSNYSLPAYDYGVEYNWRVVAWNECVSKSSEVYLLRANDLPNLHVSAVTNSSPVANQQMTVTWTVTNDGTGNTPPGSTWNDYIWISTVDGVGGGFWYGVEETLLATVPNLSSLEAGESYTNTTTVTIPRDYIGGYYLFVFTDQYAAVNIDYSPTGGTTAPDPYTPSASGSPYPYLRSQTTSYPGNFIHSQVQESRTSENLEESDNFFYRVLTILPPPSPDLAVTHISHPTNIFSGNELQVQWTVANQGDAAAIGRWTDAVYLQSGMGDTLNHTTAKLMATLNRTDTVAPNGEYQASASFIVPVDYMGQYTVFVETDYRNNIYESIFEQNNSSASEQKLNITLTPPPDLQVTAIEAPAQAAPGEQVEISYTVSNFGATATVANMWTDVVYLSRTTTIDDNSILATTITHRGNLAADSSYTRTISLTAPDRTSGEWHIIVRTDANNDVFEYTFEDNNTSLSQQVLTIVVPDLVVEQLIMADSVASPGQQFELTYTVANRGLGATSSTWIDAVYVTPSTIFSSQQAVQLHASRRSNMLNPDSSYTATLVFDLPTNLTGTHSLWLRTDNDDRIFEDGAESNNLTSAPNRLHIALPNLVVTDVKVADTVSLADSTLTLSWTTRNIGAGSLIGRSFTEVVTIGGQQVYAVNVKGLTLASGDSLVRRATVSLPCQNSATLNLRVVTDNANDVIESVETDNSTAPATTVNLIAPDLAVAVVEAPDTLWSGKPATFSWVVTNRGQAPIVARSMTDRAYLANNTVSYTAINLVDQYERLVTLAPGQSDTVSRTITLPNGISGTYYLHVVTNYGQTLCEGQNTELNTTLTHPLHVRLSPYPDLVAGDIELPTEINIGEFVTLNYTITNNGTGDLEQGSFNNRFYYSTSPAIYNQKNLLGTQRLTLDLAVGESSEQQASFVVPTSLSAGNYYVWAVTDVDNEIYEHTGESNNSTHSSVVNVKQYQLDIEAAALAGPTQVEWGQRATYTLTVANNSAVPTLAATWADEVYISDDEVLHPTDQRLVMAEHRTPLLADSSYTLTFSATIPMGTPSEAYLIAVVDKNNANPDIDRTNNLYVLPISVSSVPTADLELSQFSLVGGDTITAGQPALAAYTVTNISSQPVEAASWSDKLYLATNASAGNGTEIGSYARRNITLNQGESYTDTVEFTVPLPNEGGFNLVVKANAALGFYETTTDNNTALAQVSVILPPPGDLVVQTIDVDDSVVSGSTVNASWRVVNVGANTLSGSGLRSLVYVSADTIFDPADKLLGSVETGYISLANGQSVAQRLSARISGLPQGNYYLIVKTNVRNSFNEVDRTNNTSASTLPFHVSIRTLEWDTPTADTLRNNLASDFILNVGDNRGETALLTLESADSLLGAVNMLYVSHNNIGDNLNYTYSTIGQYTANPELYIPSTQAGYYGVNVYGSTPVASAEQQATLTARVIPFELRQASPSTGGVSGPVTLELIGSRFRPDMQVYLSRGADTLRPDTLIYDGYYRSYATFNLVGADTGFYDLGVVNYCEGEAMLARAFHAVAGAPDGLQYNLVFPNSPRPNRNIVMMLEFGNTGNTDLSGVVLEIESIGGSWISLTPDGIANQAVKLQVPLTIEGEPEGLLRPGSYGTISIYGYTSGTLVFTTKRVR